MLFSLTAISEHFLNWILILHVCANCLIVPLLLKIQYNSSNSTKCHFVKSSRFFLINFFVLFFLPTQFSQTVGKCFQIYISNLGIMDGFFRNFTKSLIFYHSTCIHLYIMKSLPFISKPCILGYIQCRT